jgi:hypothetical protein
MGNVIREHRRNPTTSKGKDDREASYDREREGDERVRPGESLAGAHEVLQSL